MKKSVIKRILELLAHQKYFFCLSLVLAFFSVVIFLYIPILAGGAIDRAVAPGNVNFGAISPVLLKIGIFAAVSALMQWLMSAINNKIVYDTTKRLRKKTFEKTQRMPLSYADTISGGDLVSRVINDVEQLGDGLLMGFTQFFTGIVTIGATLVFMVSINVGIAVGVVLMTPISLIVSRFISKKTYNMFKLQSEARGEQTSFINEIVGGEKVVMAYSKENDVVSKFDEINQKLSKYSLRATFFSSITNPSTRFVNGIIYAIVVMLGAGGAIAGTITVGALVAFLSYANQYTKPFNEISDVLCELQNALASAKRVFEVIDAPEEKIDDDLENISSVVGDVSMKNVCFSYLPEKPLIENLNLFVKSGQRVAIVGPTGCGKTTLINLLMRFYDVRSGDISLDGKSIYKISKKSLRQAFGMVLQDTWLFHGTIRENIVMGKPEATDEEIINAAKLSYAHGFIKRLKDGYNTYIGENGGSLSQGQKQLLCITRVMLCLPPMLILDEATSSIDTRTEVKIQEAFARMMEGRTSFIVAHRLSTIRDSDLILVMKDGHIIEMGTHEELLGKKGFYFELSSSMVSK